MKSTASIPETGKTNMSDTIHGPAFVVGDNIDTDQIIPAQYLNLVPTIPEEYEKLGSYALAGLPAEYPAFVETGETKTRYPVIVAGRNFGCGSSREHAPLAIKGAGIAAVVAVSFARIFFRNALNMGLPIFECGDIHENLTEGEQIKIDADAGVIIDISRDRTYQIEPLAPFLKDLINAGGLIEYLKGQ